jgi:hypothetical protein
LIRAILSAFELARRLFAFRTTWGLVLGFFGIVYRVWLFQSWLPGTSKSSAT